MSNLFLVTLGLWCCTQAFSSYGEWELLFAAVSGLLITVTSFAPEHRLWSTWSWVAAAHGLSSCRSQALKHRLHSCGTWSQLLLNVWNLPRPRIEPMFLALADGFLSTLPPRKSSSYILDRDTFLPSRIVLENPSNRHSLNRLGLSVLLVVALCWALMIQRQIRHVSCSKGRANISRNDWYSEMCDERLVRSSDGRERKEWLKFSLAAVSYYS